MSSIAVSDGVIFVQGLHPLPRTVNDHPQSYSGNNPVHGSFCIKRDDNGVCSTNIVVRKGVRLRGKRYKGLLYWGIHGVSGRRQGLLAQQKCSVAWNRFFEIGSALLYHFIL